MILNVITACFNGDITPKMAGVLTKMVVVLDMGTYYFTKSD